MYKSRRKSLSQNFFHNRGLVSRLVEQSSIGSNDTVIEIGPGKGIITRFLLEKAHQVVAIEKDEKLVPFLVKNFDNVNNFQLYQEDFLNYPLPQTPYKVFANPPFAIESKIIQKLLHHANPPTDAYLVFNHEFNKRLAGVYPNKFNLQYAPWFEIQIIHRFQTHDFVPKPKVVSSLAHIQLKETARIPLLTRQAFFTFLDAHYNDNKPLYGFLRKRYSKTTFEEIQSVLKLKHKTRPNQLPVESWIDLFKKTTMV